LKKILDALTDLLEGIMPQPEPRPVPVRVKNRPGQAPRR
jgi:hypothetical protein